MERRCAFPMTDRELALRYTPILHFDAAEPIPLRAVGYTVARAPMRSLSFPKREIAPPPGAQAMIEYALYWDYDIQHMYDLEHIWVCVDDAGQVVDAEASFHGRYMKLLPPIPTLTPPEDGHVHAFCQPGKHAFLPDGQLFTLLPDWAGCCNERAGGPVLVGGCFPGAYAPTAEENELSRRYIRACLAFTPTLRFTKTLADFGPSPAIMPWAELHAAIPGWIAQECGRLRAWAAKGGEGT